MGTECGLYMYNRFFFSDVEALCEIFSLKSEQEEVSDFSFSFGQTDLCEGLIAWMSHNTDVRKQHIHTLRQYVCLHQVVNHIELNPYYTVHCLLNTTIAIER